MDSLSKLKKKLRDSERLLSKKTIPSDVKVETERRINAIKFQLENTSSIALEKKYSKAFHRIKFFERKKVTKKITKVKTQLENVEDENEKKQLNDELESLQDDLHYIIFFPRDVKYISLFPSEELTNQNTINQRSKIRDLIKQKYQEGKLRNQPNPIVRWRDLSSEPFYEKKEKNDKKKKKKKDNQGKEKELTNEVDGDVKMKDIKKSKEVSNEELIEKSKGKQSKKETEEKKVKEKSTKIQDDNQEKRKDKQPKQQQEEKNQKHEKKGKTKDLIQKVEEEEEEVDDFFVDKDAKVQKFQKRQFFAEQEETTSQVRYKRKRTGDQNQQYSRDTKKSRR